MKHRKTAAELKEEISKIGREIDALDEHDARSVINESMTDEDLEVHRKSRNQLVTQLNVKLKLMEERQKEEGRN